MRIGSAVKGVVLVVVWPVIRLAGGRCAFKGTGQVLWLFPGPKPLELGRGWELRVASNWSGRGRSSFKGAGQVRWLYPGPLEAGAGLPTDRFFKAAGRTGRPAF